MAKTNTKTKAKPTAAKTNSVKPTAKRPAAARQKPMPKPVPSAEDDMSLDALIAEEMAAEAADTSGALIVSEDADNTVNKGEVYADQKSKLGVNSTDDKAPAKAKTKVAKTREAGSEASGRTRRTINADDLKAFFDNPADKLAQIDTLPKKIQDKARNVLSAISGSGTVSTYTKQAVKALTAAENGTMTAKDLKAHLLSCGYSDGTAAAQAQQQMVLLSYLGVAARDKSILTLVPASPVTKAITTKPEVAVPAAA